MFHALNSYDPEKARFENPPNVSFLPTELMSTPCVQYCLSCQQNKDREEVRVCVVCVCVWCVCVRHKLTPHILLQSLVPTPEGEPLSGSKSVGRLEYG